MVTIVRDGRNVEPNYKHVVVFFAAYRFVCANIFFFFGISLRKTTHFSELHYSSFFLIPFFSFLLPPVFVSFLFLPWFTFSFFGIFDAGSFLTSISSPSLLSNL